MKFCPSCSNLLLVEYGTPNMRYFCQSCPYIHNISNEIGTEEDWKNVDQTEATCPTCQNDKAYFMQIQIRSADEPATNFFKCTNNKCGFRWRD